MLSNKIQVKTPLRITWDLSGLTQFDEDTIALFSKIKAEFLFEFNIIANGNLIKNDNGSFWENNRKLLAGINLTIIGDADAELSQIINLFAFRTVIVDWSDFDPQAIELYAALQGKKAVRFVFRQTNILRLGELLDCCFEQNVSNLIFANPTLFNRQQEDYLIDIKILQELADRYRSELKALEQKCQLQIHDLFSEEILFGVRRREANFAGCQAGLYMAHVKADGKVYGCSSLPLLIGDISSATWEELWSSEERLRLRKQIENGAESCLSCESFNYCKGGCRGLSWVKHGDFNHVDILCEQ